jgi:hypothetical protein
LDRAFRCRHRRGSRHHRQGTEHEPGHRVSHASILL